jgi:hypothetical protein
MNIEMNDSQQASKDDHRYVAASDGQDDSRGTQWSERFSRVWLLDCGPMSGSSRKVI